ncbi:TetR/AcrR family transcriptional regulator [Ancylomarina euxinus]|uniref:TetR/AcrR family transcriptional regulator n=1 Tax=Ancylomarina euxinus TaxID=2283627 RepID=A0A425Y7K7_9BACT|nr:TetR/AcrR family transcriptional regulator [Ancylomarina euxinus]MCZ4693697.1 TetR/AcrR family transcriptional regulator [Ancylomarina euxinus]MUP13924.1 TetR family transcriptional regulator [Ancylomarina euxinus]RRG24448.1 TetR/AcrR family transcriptional regulator [Ancylomarina euxinus]
MESLKQKILVSAHALFFQCGTRSISMDDISRNLSISKKTLYQYFKNKNELIEHVLEWDLNNPRFDFQSQQHKDLNAIDCYWKFHQFVLDILKNPHHSFEYDLNKYHPELAKVFKAKKIDLFKADLLINLNQGIEEGLYRDDFNIDIISNLLIRFYLNHWNKELESYCGDDKFSGIFHRELTLYHLHGICSIKGIEYLKKISE